METEINRTELESEIVPIREFVNSLTVIETDDQNIKVAEKLKQTNTLIKAISDKFEKPVNDAHKLHKSLCAFRDEYLNPLKAFKDKINKLMIAFEVKAKAEQERLQAEKEAEARRIEAEALKLQEQALKLQENGKDEKAEAKILAAEAVQVKADEVRQQVIEKPMTKVAGISYKDNWQAVIKDVSLVPREYMVPNMTALNGLAKATKNTIAVPGVEFVNNRTVASGRW
jgi:hypothetical protein